MAKRQEVKRRKPLKYWRFVIRVRMLNYKLITKKIIKLPSFHIVTGIIAIFLLLSLGFPEIKTNLWSFRNQGSAIAIITTIANALAVIFGIALAFIVLSIESAKRLFAWHAYKRIFSIESMRELAALYLGTILFCIASLLTIAHEGDLKPVSMRLMLGAAYLFTLSLAILIHYVRKILEESESQEGIVELIESIGSSDINAMSRRGSYRSSSSLKDNPVYVAANVAKASVRTDNDLASRWILDAVLGTFEKKIKQSPSTQNAGFDRDRDTVNSFAYIIKEMASVALKVENITIFTECIEYLKFMSDICAANNILWPAFNELFEMCNTLMLTAVESGVGDALRTACSDYVSMPVQHWQSNAPKEDDLWEYNRQAPPDEGSVKSLHWDQISSHFLFGIGTLTDKAISSKNKEALKNLVSDLRFLIYRIDENQNLGSNQKAHLISHIAWLIRNPIEKAINRDLLEEDDLAFLIPYSDMQLMKRSLTKSDLQFFKDLTDIMIVGAKKNLLTSYTMNNLGAFGRGLVESVNKNPEALKVLEYVVYVFDELRKIYTKTVGRDERSAQCYIEAYGQIDSLRRWKADKKVRNKRLQTLLDKKLGLFKKRKEAMKLASNPTWNKIFNAHADNSQN